MFSGILISLFYFTILCFKNLLNNNHSKKLKDGVACEYDSRDNFFENGKKKTIIKEKFLVQRGKIFDTFFRKSSSFIFYIKADFQESC